MDEKLLKAFDIVKEEQRNADTKANLFIVLITAVITFFGKIPTTMINVDDIAGYQQLLFLMILPMLMLVLSLVPIYKIKSNNKRKPKKENTLNLFYWQTIINSGNFNEFLKEYKKAFKVTEPLSVEDEHILDQIYKNSDIMDRKASIHKLAFTIIIQFILLFFISGITVLVFRSSQLVFWLLLAANEIVIYVPFKRIRNYFISKTKKK